MRCVVCEGGRHRGGRGRGGRGALLVVVHGGGVAGRGGRVVVGGGGAGRGPGVVLGPGGGHAVHRGQRRAQHAAAGGRHVLRMRRVAAGHGLAAALEAELEVGQPLLVLLAGHVDARLLAGVELGVADPAVVLQRSHHAPGRYY